jgi:hypothetical protein
VPIQEVYYRAGRTCCLRPTEKGLQTVENEGPNSSGGGHEDDATANVVHFPRDWFGPREELVPFGPGSEEQAGDGGGEVAPVEILSPPPVRAEDFWGEDSASIHNAMQAPAGTERAGVSETVGVSGTLVAGGAAHTATGGRVPLRVRARRPLALRLGRRRALALSGVGAAAVALTVVTLGSLRSQVVRTPEVSGAIDGLSPAAISAVPPALAARPAGSRARPMHRRTARAHSRVSRARTRGTGASSSSTSSAQVASTAPAATQPSSAAPPSNESAPPTQATSDSGAGSASSPPAGPVGAGAPFGPGRLG